MGTNYYFYKQPNCPMCKRPFERLHIGKSSAGWYFALHVTETLHSLAAWEDLWRANPNGYIANEYGIKLSIAEMLLIVTQRDGGSRELSSQWCIENQAELGVNNLARRIVDWTRCVGHGDGNGTWDLVPGEFS